MEIFILILLYILKTYRFLIILYVLLGWFPNFRDSSIYRLVYNVCDPYIQKFRNIIPPIGMFDLSPLIGFLLLNFAINGLSSIF